MWNFKCIVFVLVSTEHMLEMITFCFVCFVQHQNFSLESELLNSGNNGLFISQVSDKFAFSLFDLDWDVFMQHIEGAVNRVPVLEQTGIKSTVCGPGRTARTRTQHEPFCCEDPFNPTLNLQTVLQSCAAEKHKQQHKHTHEPEKKKFLCKVYAGTTSSFWRVLI